MSAATACSVIGLCLDILGAGLLVRGILLRDMAILLAMRPLLKAEAPPENTWGRRFALRLAFCLGSRDVARTTPDHIGSYAETLWGLLLLVVGFLLQLIGQVLAH
jgi:hypothetical protein